jgi:hypothetical protein
MLHAPHDEIPIENTTFGQQVALSDGMQPCRPSARSCRLGAKARETREWNLPNNNASVLARLQSDNSMLSLI